MTWEQRGQDRVSYAMGSAKEAPNYKEWTKKELYEKAKSLDIEGRSKMNKKKLIKVLTKKWKESTKKTLVKSPKPLF